MSIKDPTLEDLVTAVEPHVYLEAPWSLDMAGSSQNKCASRQCMVLVYKMF